MISVIIPIYNTKPYLKRCIDSILNQTYHDLEVILVDDGSTDGSKDICLDYLKQDSRVVYYRLKNGGQGRARNYALDRCKGDWISFVDSDDWIENDMYESMLSRATMDDVDLVICGWTRYHGFQYREQPRPEGIQHYNNKELMKSYLQTPFVTSSMCNKLYRFKLWETVRFQELRAREDVAVLYKILAQSKGAVHIGESKYVQYVRYGSTEKSGFNINKINSVEIAHEMRNFVKYKYPDLYDYVALRPAQYCSSLMKEIVKSFQFNKENKGIYGSLYKQLFDELQIEYSAEVLQSYEYKKLKKITDRQLAFVLKSYLEGIREILIELLKKWYMFIRGNSK